MSHFIRRRDACVLIKVPSKANFIEEYTSDYAMESPFEFGTWLIDLVTPGLYCREIAETLKSNPMTREPILGYLPLSDNPAVVMKHMSKLFGANKELWHFVRGYISMMIHVCDKSWADRTKILSSITRLFNNYNATLDLKGGSDKVPLKQAFEYVLTNYSTCMRDRTKGDNLAIIKITKTLFPNFVFQENVIIGMSNTIGVFASLLNKHKQCENMIKYVMNVDDYDHYVSYIGGLEGLIAQLFWHDINGEYRSMKLQIAIDKALNNKKFGNELKKAMRGEPINNDILECALEEPTSDKNIHFEEPKFMSWTSEGLPELQCVYCGHNFLDTWHKLQHLKREFGEHFYNGHLACKHALEDIGYNASEKELFKLAKEKLYKSYGDKCKALHTKRCKNKLLFFINNFKTIHNQVKQQQLYR